MMPPVITQLEEILIDEHPSKRHLKLECPSRLHVIESGANNSFILKQLRFIPSIYAVANGPCVIYRTQLYGRQRKQHKIDLSV